MAVGNTFGATALSSYGGFWLAFGIILTPGGFQIASSIEAGGGASAFYDSFGFFLMVRSTLPPYFELHVLTIPGLVHFHHSLAVCDATVDRRLLFFILYP